MHQQFVPSKKQTVAAQYYLSSWTFQEIFIYFWSIISVIKQSARA